VSQYIRGGRKARNTMSGSSLTSGNRGNSARTRPPLLVWLGQKFQGPHTSQPAAVWLFASVVAGNANAPIQLNLVNLSFPFSWLFLCRSTSSGIQRTLEGGCQSHRQPSA
jgi:hypothetical protein